jgi:hypothetical protein
MTANNFWRLHVMPNPVESSSNIVPGKGLKPLVAMSIYPNLV